MELYPAVDIRGGRIAFAHAARGSVLGDDPFAVVAALAGQGATWIHLVDLDRAYGSGDQRDLLYRLLASDGRTRFQIGGSLRSAAAIDEFLDWGAARVVIGCAAAADRGLVRGLVQRHGGERLAAAIDATNGRVTPRGAPAAVELPMLLLAEQLRDDGVTTVIYTDVERDGSLNGPDIHSARGIAALGLDVVASGGIASLDHVRAVRDAGLAGALVGRALHEGRFSAAEALACLAA
jgi:phosphoribosylformimino-5-aminoimidazole carboxamide ribotide isomerase